MTPGTRVKFSDEGVQKHSGSGRGRIGKLPEPADRRGTILGITDTRFASYVRVRWDGSKTVCKYWPAELTVDI